MYEELVMRLREWKLDYFLNEEHEKTLDEAANAIEDLQKNLERSKEYETFWKKEANEALKKLQVAVAGAPIIIPAEEGE